MNNEEEWEGQYYHVYNRGTDKRNIFMDKRDLLYFFDSMVIVNSCKTLENRNSNVRVKIKGESKSEKDLVVIVAYCLLPNHFHMLLKENVEGGMAKFMSKLSNSYTKFFNEKYSRSGVLFQGKYKRKEVLDNKGIDLLSAYVNVNYKHHKINPKSNFVKTSLFEYLGTEVGEKICDSGEIKMIINNMGGVSSYVEYLNNQSEFFTDSKENNLEK